MFEFVKKYPETLSNDIIKEKLFEIVHSLESDDKLYREDFYFYISMCHIRYLFKNNDISIPEYKKFNAVDFENNWLNLDLTWDDPIVNDGSIDYLEHNFFLIDTNKLHQIETTEHEFDYDRYSELNT